MNHAESKVLAVVLLLLGTSLSAQGKGGGGGGGTPPPLPDLVSCNGKINSASQPLWVMSSDGADARQVLGEDCKRAFPTLSPDGLQVAFTKTRNGVSALWVVNSDGTGLHAVTPILVPVANQWARTFPMIRAVWSPVAAPDGKRKLLFADSPDPATVPRQLFVVDLDGGNRTQLTTVPAPQILSYYPASYEWSHDATRIAYLNENVGVVVAEIGVVGSQLAFTGQSVLVPPPPGATQVIEVGCANTGDRLVVAARDLAAHGGNGDLWIVDLANPLAPLRLTDTDDDEKLPTFASDDQSVLFWSYGQVGGTWVMPAIANGSRTLVHAKAQSPYHRRG